MVSSSAATPDAYVEEIEDDDRRALVTRLRELVNANIPDGFHEMMAFGMIGWCVPMEVSGPTYNGKPLGAIALASQKQYVSLYLMNVYGDTELAETFTRDWKATGRKLNMGKSCLRLKKWDDVAEDVLAQAVAARTVDEFLAMNDAVH